MCCYFHKISRVRVPEFMNGHASRYPLLSGICWINAFGKNTLYLTWGKLHILATQSYDIEHLADVIKKYAKCVFLCPVAPLHRDGIASVHS